MTIMAAQAAVAAEAEITWVLAVLARLDRGKMVEISLMAELIIERAAEAAERVQRARLLLREMAGPVVLA
jgi:hypothetical protein